MRNPIVGYIVVSSSGAHHAAPNEKGDQSTLWNGHGASLFPTRVAAKMALARTIQLRDRNLYGWDWYDDAEIVPVRAAI